MTHLAVSAESEPLVVCGFSNGWCSVVLLFDLHRPRMRHSFGFVYAEVIYSSTKHKQLFTTPIRCSDLNKLLPENLCRWKAYSLICLHSSCSPCQRARFLCARCTEYPILYSSHYGKFLCQFTHKKHIKALTTANKHKQIITVCKVLQYQSIIYIYIYIYYSIDTTLPLIHAALRYSNILSSKIIVSKNHTRTQTCTCMSELPGLPVLSTSEIIPVQRSLLALQETNFRV